MCEKKWKIIHIKINVYYIGMFNKLMIYPSIAVAYFNFAKVNATKCTFTLHLYFMQIHCKKYKIKSDN